MRPRLASVSQSALAFLVAFAATSAVIVTLAVNSANPPARPAHDAVARPDPATTARPMGRPPAPPATVGSTERALADASPQARAPSSGAEVTAPDGGEVARQLDPSLVDLIGRDVPEQLEQLLPPPLDVDLPRLEVTR